MADTDNKVEFTDHKGVKWFKYALRYTDAAGANFCFDLWATSDEDMDARLQAMKATASIDGRIHGVVDAEDSLAPEHHQVH